MITITIAVVVTIIITAGICAIARWITNLIIQ